MQSIGQLLMRYKNYLLAILALAEIVVGIFLVIRPAIRQFRETINARQALLSQERVLNDKLEELNTLQSRVQTIAAADLAKLRGLFVDPPAIAYIGAALNKYATASKLFLASFSVSQAPGAQKSTSPLAEIQLQAQLKGGGYREIKEFLRFLTLSVPIMEVSSFTFESRSASANVNLKVYTVARTARGRFDPEIFEDRRFKALLQPVQLPPVEPTGKVNPFSPPLETTLQ